MWVEDIYGVPGYGKPLAHLRETVELIRLIVARADTGELERFEGPTTGTTGASSRVHPDPAPPDPHLNRREPAAAPPPRG